MSFNAKKCNVLHLSRFKRKGHPVRFYDISDTILSAVSSAKYLGILISNDLSWSPHISTIAHKAHQRLGFVRRNLRGCPYAYRETAYQSLIRSQMEYCGAIWDPTTKAATDSLERVQRKAARWARGVYGVTSVTGLLKELGWAEMKDRWRNQRMTIIFKILNNLIAIEQDTLDIKPARRPQRNRHKNQLLRPTASDPHSPLWQSTVYRSIPEWNILPAPAAEAESLEVFKNQLVAVAP